jgi:hypothetical protein
MPLPTHDEYSAAKLQNLAKQLFESATVLNGMAESMKGLDAEELKIKHADSIKRAMKGLDAFVVAAREAMRDYKPKKKRVRLGDTGGDK